jgi:hypothetical protein
MQRPRSSARPAFRLRALTALGIALALFLQLAVSERHFEPLFSSSPVTSLSSAGGAATVPLTGAPIDDCAVCQFLALGAATDVPLESTDWQLAVADSSLPPAHQGLATGSGDRDSHQPRAPPASFSIA